MIKKHIILICVLLQLCGCRNNSGHVVQNAFYYWRTKFELSEHDLSTLHALHIQSLYVKFFDVVWQTDSKEAIPVGTMSFETSLPENFHIIPTVFITNSTLKNISEKAIEGLATNILAKIERMLIRLEHGNIPEIQIDCDWTETTRIKYFTLLKSMKSMLLKKDITLSVTIRLHQIKYYRQTGVPPVSKGMLMCYNMGTPTRIDTQNSILDVDLAIQYLNNLQSYPLPLDVAFPVFSWGVLFYHQQFVQLINNTRTQHLLDHKDFERQNDNVFLANQNTYLGAHYIYKGSQIRVEEVTIADCQRIAEFVSSKLKQPASRVSLFHYDPTIIQAYGERELLNLYTLF